MIFTIRECKRQYILEKCDGNSIIRNGNKDKTKKHRNVLHSESRTLTASPVGKNHPNCSISTSSSNSMLISTVLFIGRPAPPPRTLLATPLAFNCARGSSPAYKSPLASLQRLTFILADVSNGTMLMHRGRTPTKWTPGLSANDLSNSVCAG